MHCCNTTLIGITLGQRSLHLIFCSLSLIWKTRVRFIELLSWSTKTLVSWSGHSFISSDWHWGLAVLILDWQQRRPGTGFSPFRDAVPIGPRCCLLWFLFPTAPSGQWGAQCCWVETCSSERATSQQQQGGKGYDKQSERTENQTWTLTSMRLLPGCACWLLSSAHEFAACSCQYQSHLVWLHASYQMLGNVAFVHSSTEMELVDVLERNSCNYCSWRIYVLVINFWHKISLRGSSIFFLIQTQTHAIPCIPFTIWCYRSAISTKKK